MLTPGSAKRALSAATARSHIETSWQPAAVAMPCTRAITGCGSRVRVTISRLHSSKSAACQPSSPVWARISFRSWPAQNPRPSRGEDHDPGGVVDSDRVELGLQRRDHRPRERVVAVAAVQRQP